MAVGGLILVLSAAFILRPSRRRVIFSSKEGIHQLTEPISMVTDRAHLGRCRSSSGGDSMVKELSRRDLDNTPQDSLQSPFWCGQNGEAFNQRTSRRSFRSGRQVAPSYTSSESLRSASSKRRRSDRG